jgi:hypothetical protein
MLSSICQSMLLECILHSLCINSILLACESVILTVYLKSHIEKSLERSAVCICIFSSLS